MRPAPPSSPLLSPCWCILLLLSACSGEPSPTPETSPTPSPTLEPATAQGLFTLEAPFEGQVVLTDGLDVLVKTSAELKPGSLRLWIDDVELTTTLQQHSDQEVRVLQQPHTPGDHQLRLEALAHTGERQRVRIRYTARPGGSYAGIISHPAERIEGSASLSRPGDYLLSNGKVQFVVMGPGRAYLGMVNFGGHLIDADQVRPPWEPERDVLDGITTGFNIEGTSQPQTFTLVSDGQDGGPAILEARGPDALLETFNISSLATLFTPTKATRLPLTADDKDLPVELVERYILEPGATSLRWETDVYNLSNETLSFYFGDYFNASSLVEFFSPGAGMGVISIRPTCDWMGVLSAEPGLELALGYLPELEEESSIVSLQGVNFAMLGQNALNVMMGRSAPVHEVKAGQHLTFTRHIALGRDLGALADARIALKQKPSGYVGGTLKVGGVPVQGGRVAALRAGDNGSEAVAHWSSDASGHWGGQLEPGTYTLYAGVSGAGNPGESNGNIVPPPARTLTVEQNGQLTEDFDFVPPGRFRVTVRDEQGAPLPARVSVVGFDPSPDPARAGLELGRTLRGALFDPDWDPLPFGLAGFAYADTTGDTGELRLEPGQYMLVVSRGVTYSTVLLPLTLTPDGALQQLEARLARVLDTPGFAGGDFHIHSIDSWDAPVSRLQRAKGLLAEGLDLFAATDHTIRIDYTETLATLGGLDLIAPFVGEEITSFDIGHYNLFPAAVGSDRNLGGLDWVSPSSVGANFPSQGAYELTPSELYAAARAGDEPKVLQLNHYNNVLHGLFSLQGVDTAQTPPRALMPLTLFRQDPTQGDLFSPDWTVMELWRGYVDDQDFIFEENLGDYFNLLNQGIVRTLSANSDTHSSIEVPTGGPRTFVGLGNARGSTLAGQGSLLAQALNAGRAVLSNGPFINVRVETSAGEASLAPGGSTLVRSPDGAVRLELQVSAPAWAAFDVIEVFINNAPYPMPDNDDAPGMSSYQGADLSSIDVPRYEVKADHRLEAGSDFLLTPVQPYPDMPDAVRLEAQVSLELGTLETDAWVLVVARGTAGVSPALFPVMPALLEPDANTSLENLLDGNVGEGGVLALAVTNPLFVDVDGNGRYDPPGVMLSEPPADARVQRKPPVLKCH